MAEPTKVRIVLNGLLTERSKWMLHSTWPGPFLTVGVLGDLVPRITLGVLSEQKAKQKTSHVQRRYVCSKKRTYRFRTYQLRSVLVIFYVLHLGVDIVCVCSLLNGFSLFITQLWRVTSDTRTDLQMSTHLFPPAMWYILCCFQF